MVWELCVCVWIWLLWLLDVAVPRGHFREVLPGRLQSGVELRILLALARRGMPKPAPAEVLVPLWPSFPSARRRYVSAVNMRAAPDRNEGVD